jgi:hypothetical protein
MPYYPRKSKAPAKKNGKKQTKPRQSGYSKLSREVSLLKRKVAGEKKAVNATLIPGTALGQCYINGDSQWTVDITPRPSQGVGYDERIGRQIKLVSMSMQYQVSQQTNTSHPMQIQFYLVRIVGVPQNAGVLYQNFMLQNPITGVRDIMSTRDINTFKDYRVIKTWKCYLPQDASSGVKVIKTGRVSMKLNHFVNFQENGTTVEDGQLCLFAFADSGNSGTSQSTLPNVVVQGPETGCEIQVYTRFWYEDN